MPNEVVGVPFSTASDEATDFGTTLREPKDEAEFSALARRAIDLVSEGNDMQTALQLAGASPAVLNSSKIKDAILAVMGEEFFTSEVRREVIQQLDFKVYVEATSRGLKDFKEKGETGGLKIASEYSKLNRADPAVGLTAPAIQFIPLDTKPLQKILESNVKAADVFSWKDDEVADGESAEGKAT